MASLSASGDEFFERNIRPLLAEHCQTCHSSRIQSPMAGLRLDSRASFLRGSDTGPIVVAGRPAESKIIRAVRGELAQPMPPTGRLKPEQVALLEKWVEMGAPWPDENSPAAAGLPAQFNLEQRKREHWAWQPARKTGPPSVRDAAWPLQPTDRFLLARIEEKALKPGPDAEPGVLLRRVFFDLTGLPPAPQQVVEFLKDPSRKSYQKIVASLLDSPRFGEHWARHWMDWVRYAESHGSEGDPDTPGAWRYRDYLIRALNRDVPYDQLIREHLAGDLLARPRINSEEHLNESILGTAHLRMVEHGFQPVDPFEDRVKWADNQVDVFSKAFQGLTVSCARCHDHKFDAISQEDFYALFGVFYGARPTQVAADDPAWLDRNRGELQRIKVEIRRALAGHWRRQAADLARRLAEGAIDAKLGEPADSPLHGYFHDWRAWTSHWAAELTQRRQFNTAYFPVVWDLAKGGYEQWIGHGTGYPDQSSAPGEFVIEPEGDRVIQGIHPAGVYTHLLSRKHNGVMQSPRFRIDTDSISLRVAGADLSFAQLIIENYAVPRAGIYHLRHSPKSDQMAWVRWDTSFWKGFTAYVEFATREDVTHFLLDEEDARKTPRPRPDPARGSWIGARAVAFHNTKEPPKDELPAAAVLFEEPVPESRPAAAMRIEQHLTRAIDAWADGRITDAQAVFLDWFVRHEVLPSRLDQLGDARLLVTRYRALDAEVPVARRTPGVLEESSPDQPLLVRGSHRNPGRPVARRYLAAVDPSLFTDAKTVRLRLAEAVASPANPLTARVLVNRVWRYLFGKGIVATVDNFGKLGDRPSHPELLDWLAARFVEDGWSIKKLVALLVNSRAYQLASTSSTDAAAQDPGNRLLTHMPLRRLEAEAIRDSILAVTGQLDRAMYGPPVAVYYAHETGKTKGDKPKGPLDGNGRRSVYLEVRRNATNPFLEVFDFPVPASTRGERDLTNVPAQALALMNSPFVVEQAGRWARAITADGSVDPGERIGRMFLRALGRRASPGEHDRCATLLADLAREHATTGTDLMTDPRPWRDFAQALFNLKEFVYVR